MAQANSKNRKVNTSKTKNSQQRTPAKKSTSRPIRREVIGAILGFIFLYSFLGYFVNDAILITWIKKFVGGLVGWGFYIFPPCMLLGSVIMFTHRGRPVLFRFICTLILPILFGSMTDLLFSKANISGSFFAIVSLLYSNGSQLALGGVISGLISFSLKAVVSTIGAFPLLLLSFVYFLLSAFNISVSGIKEWLKGRELAEYPIEEKVKREPVIKEHRQAVRENKIPTIETFKDPRKAIDVSLDDNFDDLDSIKPQNEHLVKPRVKSRFGAKKADGEAKQNATDNVKPVTIEEAEAISGVKLSESSETENKKAVKEIKKEEIEAETVSIANEIVESSVLDTDDYMYPNINLLDVGKASSTDSSDEIDTTRKRLESTITSFGVPVKLKEITNGPTVTRYDFELEQGVKLSKITNLAGDIALALGVVSVRIAPIPDMISTVGIEVPNKKVSSVYLRDIIDTSKFRDASSKLSVALGKDIGGDAIIANISKLPHLLIAGTTGSGKSVCMNSLIISLLYKARPDEVKFIMIDPKMVELGAYNGIPHLYIPVVTDPKKAAGALQWSVVEMLKRYRLFSEAGVRDLASYNEHMSKEGNDTLPQVVIVIDELADLMMAASKEVEESICRVAQMGRAAGMHLVIATQRPSADVITGLMKANIPSRIAFAVSSAMESRIILDQVGAEKLVGMGDMLFAPVGTGKPVRIQGAFVSDDERERVIKHITQQTKAEYRDDIMASIDKSVEEKNSKESNSDSGKSAGNAGDYDELLPQAVDVIFDTKQASVSMLQRRLKLGYSRAARLVDQMEELGIVGPFEGSKPRQVLITKEQWQEMQMIHGTAPTEIMETRMEFGDDSEFDYNSTAEEE